MDAWTILTTVLQWAWMIIVAPTHLFWPVGQLVSLAYLVIIIVVIRRYTPTRVKRIVAGRTAPVLWTTTTPVRWYVVTWLANPEWIASGGTRIIEKPVEVLIEVPSRRTFRKWLASALKWTLFGALLASIAWNYATVSAWSSFFTPR